MGRGQSLEDAAWWGCVGGGAVLGVGVLEATRGQVLSRGKTCSDVHF